ncbi:MAG: hypothetical protein GY953_50870, partial [bacterium]|nr:hypothetical protein [bacterium]
MCTEQIQRDAPLDAAAGERPHPGWNWIDNEITLTANEPASWSVFTGQPKGLSPFQVLDPGFPPGRPDPDAPGERMLRGYVIGFAVNEFGEQIRWNHLAGGATIVNYRDASAWQYCAWAFSARGNPIAANGDPVGTPGMLNLDGVEYAAPYSHLLMHFHAVGSSRFSGGNRQVIADTDVTILPGPADLRQETDGPVTTKAHFDVWNENEVKFSGAHRCVTCWDQTLLSAYDFPNHFLQFNLQTAVGMARIDGLASQDCDFDYDLSDGP